MEVKVRGKVYELTELTKKDIWQMRQEMGLSNKTCPLCHDSNGNFFMRVFPTDILQEGVKQYKEEKSGEGVCMKCICLAGRLASDGDENRKQRTLNRLGLGKVSMERLKELDLWQGREYKPKKRRRWKRRKNDNTKRDR